MKAWEVWTYEDGAPDYVFEEAYTDRLSAFKKCSDLNLSGRLAVLRETYEPDRSARPS